MIENALSRFEAAIRLIIEDGLAGFFGGHVDPLDIAGRLLMIIDKKKTNEAHLQKYIVLLHPENYQHLIQKYPNLTDVLLILTRRLGVRTGVDIGERLDIIVETSARIGKKSVQIQSKKTR